MRSLSDYVFSQEEKQLTWERKTKLQSAISVLPIDNKKVIELHFMQKVSRKGVAQNLGWSLSKVNAKITRGITLLRWQCNPAAFEDAKKIFARHIERIIEEKIV